MPLSLRDPDLLSIAEAAELLGISKDTAYKLAKAGEFPGAIRLGRQWRVSLPRMRRALHADPD